MIFSNECCKLNRTMFTGIVGGVGEIRRVEQNKIIISSPGIVKGLSLGGSVAVNGVCLTAIRVDPKRDEFEAELSPETLKRTNLGRLRPGGKVNLELPLTAEGRFDGHIVLGHVDTVGEILSLTPQGNSFLFSFEVDPQFESLLVEKGSVAVDGISLTAFNVRNQRARSVRSAFDVAIIPHTYEVTNLRYRKVRDKVNIEFDILGKYIERMVGAPTKRRRVIDGLRSDRGCSQSFQAW